jgi:DNA-binding NtrC family response regulator
VDDLSAPFPEQERMTQIRGVTRRLAATSIPVIVAGEAGTGRRTLARAIARLRAAAEDWTEVFGARVPVPHEPVILVHDVETLADIDQWRLAMSIAAGARVVAWGSERTGPGLHPELAALLLNGAVALPPLRERGVDAAAWADFFLQQGLASPARLSRAARTAVLAYPWPGNLSQLRSTLACAVALLGTESLDAELGPEDLGIDADPTDMQPLAMAVEQFRSEYIQRALARFGGNRSRTARALGVDTRSPYFESHSSPLTRHMKTPRAT